MSYFRVEVVRIDGFGKHPDPETTSLSITNIFGYPVIFKSGTYNVGDLVAYIPVDAVVPLDRPEFSWLAKEGGTKKTERVRAKRLRGKFSMGFLVPAPAGSKEGDDVKDILGVVKYEEPEPISTGGDAEKDPGFAPKYDVENFRRYGYLFRIGEEVVVTEKIHGANGMFCFHDGVFWVKSHHQYKREFNAEGNPTTSMWWVIARRLDLAAKMATIPDLAMYGEVYGQVQDLKYDAKPGELFFRAFDLFDVKTGDFIDYDKAKGIVTGLGVDWVPEVYRGPFDPEKIHGLADGKSTIASNIREGIVIKPIVERYESDLGRRLSLKLVSEAYLLRKGGTEHH